MASFLDGNVYLLELQSGMFLDGNGEYGIETIDTDTDVSQVTCRSRNIPDPDLLDDPLDPEAIPDSQVPQISAPVLPMSDQHPLLGAPVRRRISCKSKDPAFKVGACKPRKPCKPRDCRIRFVRHRNSSLAGWPGTCSQPCSVYWQCAVQHAQLHVPGGFDLNLIQDLILPVKEELKRETLLFRIFGEFGVLQVTEKMFRGTKNARHAITVLQFCQAAGLTKEQLDEVKCRLRAEIVNEAGETRMPWNAD